MLVLGRGEAPNSTTAHVWSLPYTADIVISREEAIYDYARRLEYGRASVEAVAEFDR